jgi:hypothetical protein
MSWKNIFPRNVLLKYLVARGHVFCIDESISLLVEKLANKKEWENNRQSRQEDLLQLIKSRPKIFDLVYKLLDFIIKDRQSFKIKCSQGADDPEAIVWEYRHREDKLLDFKETRRKQRISKNELKRIVSLFFLAAPELFIEDRRENGKKFYIFPKSLDSLYFLSSTQAELDELYAGLKTDNPVFLESWWKMLS